MADKNTFRTHWFLIKLKNVTINQIQFITSGTDTRGGLISGELIIRCVFCLQSYKGGLWHVIEHLTTIPLILLNSKLNDNLNSSYTVYMIKILYKPKRK